MENKLGVNVFGFIGGEFGLGEAVRLIIKALKKAEIPTSLINYDIETNHRHSDTTFANLNSEVIYPINLVLMGPYEAKRIFFHYPEDFFTNTYNIFYLNWESEYISEEYVNNLELYNEIWVPSQYCKDILAKYSKIPIHIIPYPIEIAVDNKPDEEAEQFYNKNSFNFLFMFDYNSTIERKNTINLIDAFEKAFGKNDESVSLNIKTSKSTRFSKEKALLESHIKDFKNIKIYEKIYDVQTLYKIIKGCDAYISLHRSEGFGLTMAEAMYFGKPVIATNYSGNLQFMNDSNSFLVDYKLTKTDSNLDSYDHNTVWSEPNTDHAAEFLKLVKENSQFVQSKAQKGQDSIFQDFSTEKIGNTVHSRIEDILKIIEDRRTKNHLIQLLIENERITKELKKIKSSKLIAKILDIKQYVRDVKKRR